MFDSGEHQARILKTLPALKSMSRMIYAHMLQQTGYSGLGPVMEMEVVVLLLIGRAQQEMMY